MAATKATTNEDLLETMQTLMQMTSDGFERLENRMDRLEERMDRLEARMDKLELRVSAIEQRLSEHDVQFAEIKLVLRAIEDNHAAYINDIEDILDRIQVLEDRMPNLTAKEFSDLQNYLHDLSDWARRVAKVTRVPLKLHS